MSHIHIPDGVINTGWCLGGFILCFILMGSFIVKLKEEDSRRKVPLLGIVAAIMLLIMNIPLGIIPVHISLSVLAGILVGPSLGFIAAFTVNVILALLGHGGVTLIGINTIMMWAEISVGWLIYRLLSGKIRKISASVVSVVIAILVSSSLMLSFIGLTIGVDGIFEAGHIHSHQHDAVENNDGNHEGEGSIGEFDWLFFTGWSAIILILLVGIGIESIATATIINFLSKVRPDLIDG